MTRTIEGSCPSASSRARGRLDRTLNIRFKPYFDSETRDPKYIDIESEFHSGHRARGDVLVKQGMFTGTIPSQQYSRDSVEACDPSGRRISLYTHDTVDLEREFMLCEDLPPTTIVLRYRAHPRKVDEDSLGEPVSALEEDGGGLAGMMDSFVLMPYNPDGDYTYELLLDWNLTSSPEDTRVVCSLGEGPQIRAVQKLSALDSSFMLLGPFKSHYARGNPSNDDESSTGTFWLSEPLIDMIDLGEQIEQIVPYMQSFFEDDTQLSLFRIFAQWKPYKCVSGRGLHHGFVFAWNTIMDLPDSHRRDFIFHELVHNWPQIGSHSTDGKLTEEESVDVWFNEGIAEYYSTLMPYRLGMISEIDLVSAINVKISGYYTNPDRHYTNRDVVKKFWSGHHINRIPYQRGFTYFLKIAYQLHSGPGRRSLDELVRIMVKLRLTGQPHHIDVWLSLLTAELGPDARDEYRRMSEAELIVLPWDFLSALIPSGGNHWNVVRQDQEEFYFGFPEYCFSRKRVDHLDQDSRAAEAGVRNGDVITPFYTFHFLAEQWHNRFEMTVCRDGHNEKLNWWPRSYDKVESYQLMRVRERGRIAAASVADFDYDYFITDHDIHDMYKESSLSFQKLIRIEFLQI